MQPRLAERVPEFRPPRLQRGLDGGMLGDDVGDHLRGDLAVGPGRRRHGDADIELPPVLWVQLQSHLLRPGAANSWRHGFQAVRDLRQHLRPVGGRHGRCRLALGRGGRGLRRRSGHFRRVRLPACGDSGAAFDDPFSVPLAAGGVHFCRRFDGHSGCRRGRAGQFAVGILARLIIGKRRAVLQARRRPCREPSFGEGGAAAAATTAGCAAMAVVTVGRRAMPPRASGAAPGAGGIAGAAG